MTATTAAERAARARRLAEVFGEVLPDQTRDEREDPEVRADQRSGDERLRREVPPHHGAS